MITKPSQLHTKTSRHISSCIPSSKREEESWFQKHLLFQKVKPLKLLQPFPHWGPKTLHLVAFGQPFPSLPRWPWQIFTVESKCRQSAWPSNRLLFFLRQPVEFTKTHHFSGNTSGLSRIYLDPSFFSEAKTQPLEHSTGGSAFLGSQPQLHSAKVGVSAAWPPSSGVVWYYYRDGFWWVQAIRSSESKGFDDSLLILLAFRHPWLSWQQNSMEKQWETLGKNSTALASTCNKPKHNDLKQWWSRWVAFFSEINLELWSLDGFHTS